MRFTAALASLARMKTTRLCGLALAILLSGCTPEAPYTPVADVQDLMNSIIDPAADFYWDAVGWIIDENGTLEIEPGSPEAWDSVRSAAVVVTESANLLMMEGRARNQGNWMTYSQAMLTAGRRAIEAAEARDKMAVFDVGAEIYYSCTACHATHAVETLRPNVVIE